jgi:SAM-dependent methyltransferase
MLISWYRQKVTDFGLARATWLLWRIVWGRARVIAGNALLPDRFACPCCGWRGHRFFDYVEAGYTVPNASCPQCDSHSRHRTFFLWLKAQYEIDRRAGNALVFAPERALAPLWATAAGLFIVRTDIEPSRGVDVIADIMHLPFQSEFASLVWCHHVLEQVEDDQMALRELRRVLASVSGELIISVGRGDSPETQELGVPDKALSGNRRLYGADFVDRLRAAGFDAQPLTCDLTEGEKRTYGLYEEPFYLCRKT